MWRFVKDIFDVKNIFGMQRTPIPIPIPQYPANETVLQGISDSVRFTPYYSSGLSIQVTKTYNGITSTNTFDDSYSGIGQFIQIDEGTDVIITGSLQRIDCGNDVELLAVGNTITFIPAAGIGTSTRILDTRNISTATIANPLNANIVDTIYAIPNTTPARLLCERTLAASSVAVGILFIDRSATFADQVIAAATAKGWQIYDL